VTREAVFEQLFASFSDTFDSNNRRIASILFKLFLEAINIDNVIVPAETKIPQRISPKH
jgi:hypothetical protein